jgi:hypothetical protein
VRIEFFNRIGRSRPVKGNDDMTPAARSDFGYA